VGDTNPETSEGAAEEDDASSKRRSKRTPIPKRNFKLVDNYQDSSSKEPSKKKDRKSKGRKSVDAGDNIKTEPVDDDQPALPPSEEAPEPQQGERKSSKKSVSWSVKEEQEQEQAAASSELSEQVFLELPADPTEGVDDEEEEAAPRKSGRVRKPKEFKDSITPSYVKKSVERSKKTNPDAEVVNPPDPPQPQPAEKKSQSRKRKASDSSEKKPVPLSVFDQEVAQLLATDQIKEEPLTDSQNEDEGSVPSKKSRRRRTASTSANDEATVSPAKINTKLEDANDSATPVKRGASIKLKIKPMAERLVEEPVKETPKASKKKSNEASSSSARKKAEAASNKKRRSGGSGGKLIVSFKKKTSERRQQATTDEDTANDKDTSLLTDKLLPTPQVEVKTEDPSEEPSSSKKKKSPSNKKKKKKEKKKKLDNDSQKLIEVKRFEEVEDQSIVKVKKKKVYKKRKGSKVLVRIIKNHCNRGGEIVKTEVVAVDSVPVSDGEKANGSLTQGVGEDSMMVDDDDEIADDEDEDDEEMTLINQGINPKDEEWVPEDEKPSISSRTKRIKKPPPSKDIPAEKKKTKTSAAMTDKKKTSTKGSSRKGGKNVTIGGKVVGKTTKGMKTTGESKDLTIKKSKKPCPCCTGKLLKISESSNNVVYNTASSEPKNAYNLFCRKYRPIIVQNHPRADFAEISRRLAHIWNKASAEDRAGYFEVFSKMECAFRKKIGISWTSVAFFVDGSRI